jgi:glycosyltransferase involved in cell wall biosynthesis
MDSQVQKPDAWIVVDNSTNPDEDWSIANWSPLLIYERVEGEKPVAWLRNRCIELALAEGADYLVFWDDDDYYPPTRISSGVAALESNPDADISGSSRMYLLLVRENVLMTTGPFGDSHCTAATFTVRRRYFETHRFNPDDKRGEERVFTGEWTAKVVQVPADEMIVVMGHGRNTVDKSDLLLNPKRYNAAVVNADNGKMIFRVRWPVQWDRWRSTFSVGGCERPPASNPSVESQTAIVPTLHTEATGESDGHRA